MKFQFCGLMWHVRAMDKGQEKNIFVGMAIQIRNAFTQALKKGNYQVNVDNCKLESALTFIIYRGKSCSHSLEHQDTRRLMHLNHYY